MSDRLGRMRDEDGFSAAELMFAAMLGLMVMTVAYLIFETALKSFRQIEVQTVASTTAARVAQRLAKPIRETARLAIPGDYDILVLADNNDDGDMEWNHYFLDGTRLMRETKATDLGATTGTPVVVADNVQNLSQSVPLFTYYSDPASSPLPARNLAEVAERQSGTAVVRMVVLTRGPGTPAPPVYRLQTDVFLRNKSTQ